MKTKRIAIAAVVAALSVVAVSAVVALGSAKITSATVSDYDLSGLGMDLALLDSTAAARVSAGQTMTAAAASDKAVKVLGGKGAPETLHVMARPETGSDLRPVWIVLYKGGNPDMFPAGPVGEDYSVASRKAPAYTGVMLDDVTGDVLLVFGGGTQ